MSEHPSTETRHLYAFFCVIVVRALDGIDNTGFYLLGWWMIALSHLFVAMMRPCLLDVRPQQVHSDNRPHVFISWIHVSVFCFTPVVSIAKAWGPRGLFYHILPILKSGKMLVLQYNCCCRFIITRWKTNKTKPQRYVINSVNIFYLFVLNSK